MSEGPTNTHYALLGFAGDFDDDHPDEHRRGKPPDLMLLAAGSEEFCWEAAARWTGEGPLLRDEWIEVVTRDPAVAREEAERAELARERSRRERGDGEKEG